MKQTHKHLLIILLLVGISIFALKTLFHSGFYTSHDGWHQVARLYHFDQAIRDGQFPPRWSGLLYHGFGYPIFLFSYHLPWLIAEPFVLSGASIFAAIKIVFILTYILSGLVMYFWISEMWGKKAGFISAFVYLFTPYRFANILVRANIGEAVSYAFFPFIFWALYRLSKQRDFKAIVMGAFGVSGFLLSHVMVGFLFAALGISYFLVLLVHTKQKLFFLLSSGLSILLGFGVAAYYFIPAVVYKPLTVFQQQYHDLYRNYFTPLKLLLYSPWGYGALGTAGEMSRQIGLIILVILGLTICFVLWKFHKRNFSLSTSLAFVLIINFIFAVYMMTKSSLPIWQLVEKQTLIDFPWRFLAVTTFIGSILTGFLLIGLKNKYQYVLVVLILMAAVYTNRNHLRVNQYTDIPLSLYIDSELSTNTDDEYLPKWVDRQQAKEEKPLVALDGGELISVAQNTKQITFTYNIEKATSAKIHHMFFPGWEAMVDTIPLPITKNEYGGMKLELPEGKHSITMQYKSPPLLRAAELVSVFSLGFCVFLLWKRRTIAGKLKV